MNWLKRKEIKRLSKSQIVSLRFLRMFKLTFSNITFPNAISCTRLVGFSGDGNIIILIRGKKKEI